MKTKEVLDVKRFQAVAERIVNFDDVPPYCEPTSMAPNGEKYLSFGFFFQRHEYNEVLLRWEQWIQSLMITYRDRREEGQMMTSLLAKPAMRIYWREFPEITEHETYPGQYKITARIMIDKRCAPTIQKSPQ